MLQPGVHAAAQGTSHRLGARAPPEVRATALEQAYHCLGAAPPPGVSVVTSGLCHCFALGEWGRRVLHLRSALSWMGAPLLGSTSEGCASALICTEPEGHAATTERGVEDWRRGRDYEMLRVGLGFGRGALMCPWAQPALLAG